MTERHASERLSLLYGMLHAASATGKPLPAEALPPLLKAVLSAFYLTQELEEELAIADRQLAIRNHRRGSVDIDQLGNVVHLPARLRVIRIINPDGGNAA